MNNPTLNEVKQFLAGTASDDVCIRIKEALQDTSSRTSRIIAFVEKGRTRDPLRWPILDITRIWPWEQERFPSAGIDAADRAIRNIIARIRYYLTEQASPQWQDFRTAATLASKKLPPEHPMHRLLASLRRELLAFGPEPEQWMTLPGETPRILEPGERLREDGGDSDRLQSS